MRPTIPDRDIVRVVMFEDGRYLMLFFAESKYRIVGISINRIPWNEARRFVLAGNPLTSDYFKREKVWMHMKKKPPLAGLRVPV